MTFYPILKRTVDAALATVMLVVLAIPMLVIGALVKATSGSPVLFRQKRIGSGGEPFEILKYRTMVSDAHVEIDSTGRVMNPARDPRITAVGSVLRRWSLDELPQLINILRGEMSFIGPRPDLPEALDLYTAHQRTKLDVRPGMSGLAQVSGRNSLAVAESWNLDAEYAQSSSLKTDLQILGRTFRIIVGGSDLFTDESP